MTKIKIWIVWMILLLSFSSAEGKEKRTLEDLVSFDARRKPLGDFANMIAKQKGVQILVDPSLQEKVTLRMEKVHWKTAMEAASKQIEGSFQQVFPKLYIITKLPFYRIKFSQAEIQTVLLYLAQKMGKSIVLSSRVQGKITLSFQNMPYKSALEAVSQLAGLKTIFYGKDFIIVMAEEEWQRALITNKDLARQILSAEKKEENNIFVPCFAGKCKMCGETGILLNPEVLSQNGSEIVNFDLKEKSLHEALLELVAAKKINILGISDLAEPEIPLGPIRTHWRAVLYLVSEACNAKIYQHPGEEIYEFLPSFKITVDLRDTPAGEVFQAMAKSINSRAVFFSPVLSKVTLHLQKIDSEKAFYAVSLVSGCQARKQGGVFWISSPSFLDSRDSLGFQLKDLEKKFQDLSHLLEKKELQQEGKEKEFLQGIQGISQELSELTKKIKAQEESLQKAQASAKEKDAKMDSLAKKVEEMEGEVSRIKGLLQQIQENKESSPALLKPSPGEIALEELEQHYLKFKTAMDLWKENFPRSMETSDPRRKLEMLEVWQNLKKSMDKVQKISDGLHPQLRQVRTYIAQNQTILSRILPLCCLQRGEILLSGLKNSQDMRDFYLLWKCLMEVIVEMASQGEGRASAQKLLEQAVTILLSDSIQRKIDSLDLGKRKEIQKNILSLFPRYTSATEDHFLEILTTLRIKSRIESLEIRVLPTQPSIFPSFNGHRYRMKLRGIFQHFLYFLSRLENLNTSIVVERLHIQSSPGIGMWKRIKEIEIQLCFFSSPLDSAAEDSKTFSVIHNPVLLSLQREIFRQEEPQKQVDIMSRLARWEEHFAKLAELDSLRLQIADALQVFARRKITPLLWELMSVMKKHPLWAESVDISCPIESKGKGYILFHLWASGTDERKISDFRKGLFRNEMISHNAERIDILDIETIKINVPTKEERDQWNLRFRLRLMLK